MKKRMMSLFLALIMLLTVVPVGALADGAVTVEITGVTAEQPSNLGDVIAVTVAVAGSEEAPVVTTDAEELAPVETVSNEDGTWTASFEVVKITGDYVEMGFTAAVGEVTAEAALGVNLRNKLTVAVNDAGEPVTDATVTLKHRYPEWNDDAILLFNAETGLYETNAWELSVDQFDRVVVELPDGRTAEIETDKNDQPIFDAIQAGTAPVEVVCGFGAWQITGKLYIDGVAAMKEDGTSHYTFTMEGKYGTAVDYSPMEAWAEAKAAELAAGKGSYEATVWKDGGTTWAPEETYGQMGVAHNYVWVNVVTTEAKPSEYVVRFHANGGEGKMDDQPFVWDVAQTLNRNEFTRRGYTFLGWTTEPNGGTFYRDEQTVKNLTDVNGGVVNLYASWVHGESFVITATHGAYGDVTPAGEILVMKDGDQTFTFRPNRGYRVKAVYVDGIRIGACDSFTFYDVDRDHTIHVEFAPKHWNGCPTDWYVDLSSDAWYHDATDYMISKGLMTGEELFRFNPYGTTTRAMVVTILYRMEGQPGVKYTAKFSDVAAGAWYTDAVLWAASKGIVTGHEEGTFCPEDAVTREQLAAILWRYVKYKGVDVSVGENTNILSYHDCFEINEYAIPAMQWACGAGIMHGDGAGYLNPQGNTLRVEAAAMFYRMAHGVLCMK